MRKPFYALGTLGLCMSLVGCAGSGGGINPYAASDQEDEEVAMEEAAQVPEALPPLVIDAEIIAATLVDEPGLFEQDHSQTYLRRVTPRERGIGEFPITFRKTAVSLSEAIAQVTGYNAMPDDSRVDMTATATVSAIDMPASDYLEYVSNLYGYDVYFDEGLIRIGSPKTQRFNLAHLPESTDWSSLFDEPGQAILRVGEVEGAFVSVSPSERTVVAGGARKDLAAFEAYVADIAEEFDRQVLVDISILDVEGQNLAVRQLQTTVPANGRFRVSAHVVNHGVVTLTGTVRVDANGWVVLDLVPARGQDTGQDYNLNTQVRMPSGKSVPIGTVVVSKIAASEVAGVDRETDQAIRDSVFVNDNARRTVEVYASTRIVTPR